MSERILIVEDNQQVLSQLQLALSQEGYQVTTAVNGLDGYNKAQQQMFDLCVVDHLMPLMAGPQLLKNLSALGSNRPSCIIFLSTQELKSVQQLSEISYADKILSKPLDIDVFIQSVKELLEYEDAVA